jgi:hypothetical protein
MTIVNIGKEQVIVNVPDDYKINGAKAFSLCPRGKVTFQNYGTDWYSI